MANMKVDSLGSAARRNRQDSEVKDRKVRGTFRSQRELEEIKVSRSRIINVRVES